MDQCHITNEFLKLVESDQDLDINVLKNISAAIGRRKKVLSDNKRFNKDLKRLLGIDKSVFSRPAEIVTSVSTQPDSYTIVKSDPEKVKSTNNVSSSSAITDSVTATKIAKQPHFESTGDTLSSAERSLSAADADERTCVICYTCFFTKEMLGQHMQNKHQRKSVSLPEMWKKIDINHDINMAKKNITSKTQYYSPGNVNKTHKCGPCGKWFNSKQYLAKHKKLTGCSARKTKASYDTCEDRYFMGGNPLDEDQFRKKFGEKKAKRKPLATLVQNEDTLAPFYVI